jgi:hypothetical protein
MKRPPQAHVLISWFLAKGAVWSGGTLAMSQVLFTSYVTHKDLRLLSICRSHLWIWDHSWMLTPCSSHYYVLPCNQAMSPFLLGDWGWILWTWWASLSQSVYVLPLWTNCEFSLSLFCVPERWDVSLIVSTHLVFAFRFHLRVSCRHISKHLKLCLPPPQEAAWSKWDSTQSQRGTVGNPDWLQQIIPTKVSFWRVENIQLCKATFSPPHCALNIPTLWPEIDGTQVESLVRGQMIQPWLSLVSKSPFLPEVVQKDRLIPIHFPHSLSTSHLPKKASFSKGMCSRPWARILGRAGLMEEIGFQLCRVLERQSRFSAHLKPSHDDTRLLFPSLCPGIVDDWRRCTRSKQLK